MMYDFIEPELCFPTLECNCVIEIISKQSFDHVCL